MIETYTIRDLLNEAGPFLNGDEPASDQELFDQLNKFGRLSSRVTPAEAAYVKQLWVDQLTLYFSEMSDPWRLVDAAMKSGKTNSFSFPSMELSETQRIPRPITEFLNDPDLDAETHWILHGYAARGELTVLAGPPKVGKTTILAHLATHVARGYGFLDRVVQQCPVLWIDLEQHPRRTAKLFKPLETDDAPIYVFSYGSLAFDLEAFIKEYAIGLVVIDSLSKYWDVQDENDSVQVTHAIQALRELALNTDCAIVLIHHTRKSGGQDGMEVRGSGALTAAVDVSVSIKRDYAVENRRVLEAISRDEATPRTLLVEYEGGIYRALGTVGEVKDREERRLLVDALSDEPLTTGELTEATELSERSIRRLTKQLYQENAIQQKGTGKKGDPFRFSRKEI